MSVKSNLRLWLLGPVFFAASWITFRVMAADPPPAARASVVAAASADSVEVRDPALERMISRFATEARRDR